MKLIWISPNITLTSQKFKQLLTIDNGCKNYPNYSHFKDHIMSGNLEANTIQKVPSQNCALIFLHVKRLIKGHLASPFNCTFWPPPWKCFVAKQWEIHKIRLVFLINYLYPRLVTHAGKRSHHCRMNALLPAFCRPCPASQPIRASHRLSTNHSGLSLSLDVT